MSAPGEPSLPRFDRRFEQGGATFAQIGGGALGGKGAGLQRARDALRERPASAGDQRIAVSVPSLMVVGTEVFETFVERNALRALIESEPGDHHVARAFQRAELPAEIAGDLWDLVRQAHLPFAVRSSSLLEDAEQHPFAGVYRTKFTPNDALDPQHRFQRLVEAIKFVWASACFRDARAAIRAAGLQPKDERMAVLIQEVVGRRRGARFYPDVSGVARSINYYPAGSARAEDGVVQLALGLGKQIVDGGRAWVYSPASPRSGAPFASIEAELEETQRSFWAVRMGKPTEYDPTRETEYMESCDLELAERDGALRWCASTFDPERDRIVPGISARGPRVLDFAPLLQHGPWPVNAALRGLLDLFGERERAPVEIELALELPDAIDRPARLGLLQVRAMATDATALELGDADEAAAETVVASRRVLGNGVVAGLRDIVFVRRDRFEARHTQEIAAEVEALNRELVAQGRAYVLIGFGRWGSSEPWLGIPVSWAQVAGAKVIVESSTPALSADMSQGAHFFHNLLGFRVQYFSLPPGGSGRIDWDWIEALPRVSSGTFVVHARSPVELVARSDGRRGRGVVQRRAGDAAR